LPRRRLTIATLALAAAAALAPVASAAPAAAPVVEFASLRGATEAPMKGDPDGRGSAALLIVGKTRVCFAILVTGIDKPILAHIHKGAPGVAGPIVVALTPPPKGTLGTVAGCTTGPAKVVADIKSHPGRYYVNVHTSAFPAGALRGQLVAAR
jgi:CHRD domain-containing protein